MTTPRKRAPGGGRKPSGNVRHTVSLPPALWAHVDAQAGDTRSARLAVVVGRDMEHTDKNRGVNMASDLATRVAATDGRVYRWQAQAHDVIPRRYTLTWWIRLVWYSAYVPDERSKVYTMSADVDYTADEIYGIATVLDNVIAANVEQLAAMLQEKIKQWQWEEATAGLRITEVAK